MAKMTLDSERLWNSIQELGQIGKNDSGGLSRVSGSEANKEARDRLLLWFEELGLTIQVDPVGNIVARRPGQLDKQPVITGSHIDTVPDGGKFDGAAGILAALEIFRSWEDENVKTKRPVDLVVFTEEEGTRFGRGLLGSAVASGKLPLDSACEIKDDEGKTVQDVMANIGYFGNDHIDLSTGKAFVELHVEQGPFLYHNNIEVGIVTDIVGICQCQVSFDGKADHAGTTPMDLRKDAFTAASKFSEQFNNLIDKNPSQSLVGTIGKVIVSPNATNVIPGKVTMDLDIRDNSNKNIDLIIDGVNEICNNLNFDDINVNMGNINKVPASELDNGIISKISKSCESYNISYSKMISGAGHDTMNVADILPSGMIFTPSKDGISHHPEEYTSPDSLLNGATVLGDVLHKLANE